VNAWALAGLAVLAALLGGCPDPPSWPGVDDIYLGVNAPDAGPDADVFHALELQRLSPAAGPWEGGQRVTLRGVGFTKGAEVFFGDTPAVAALVLDGGTLNCTTPPGPAAGEDPGASAPARARLVDVRVVLLDGQEATLPDAYLYRGPLGLTSVSPSRGPTGPKAADQEITIRGLGFDETTRVLVGGRALRDLEVLDAETIRGRAPARLVGHAGPTSVIVTDGFEQRTLAGAYTYVDPLTVTWLTPPSGAVEGGAVVTLYGTGLESGTLVRVGDRAAETLVDGQGTALVVRVPPALGGSPGPAVVTVDNGVEVVEAPAPFVYTAASAAVPGVSAPPTGSLALVGAWPARVDAAGGAPVALTVLGLADAGAAKGLTVTVQGAPAVVQEVRAGQDLVVVVAPPGVAGPAPIEVATPDAADTRGDLLRYDEARALVEASPAAGPTGGGQTVLLQGRGLAADARVWFGAAEAPGPHTATADGLRVRTPPGVPGTVDVTVEVPAASEEGGGGVRRLVLGAGYEYRAASGPELWAVDPPMGSQAGGRIVRIYGRGLSALAGDPAVRFGGEVAPLEQLGDDAHFVVRAPRGEPGEVNVRGGEGDGGLGLLAMAYRYFDHASDYGGTSGGAIPEALNVSVRDMVTRAPVEGAYVILWDDLGTPFQGITDDRGQVTFSALGFGAPQMVTASKDNFTTGSVVDFDARDVTLLLYGLVPSDPGSGGGDGPQPIPDGDLGGRIEGVDKYLIVPPGRCDLKTPPAGSDLCAPCQTDVDCVPSGPDAPAERCTELGDQGRFCTTACTTSDDCPEGFSCVGVGFGAVQCVPSPGERAVWCGTTQPDVFTAQGDAAGNLVSGLPASGFGASLTEYRITSAPGERAVVCMGGYMEPDLPADQQVFVPLMMGVRRHVFTMPGELVSAQDVKLDIPLTRTLRVRLEDAPPGLERQVQVFLDLGSDGVFLMPSVGTGTGRDTFSLNHFPAKLEDSLYDATYTVLAVAYPPSFATGESQDSSVIYEPGLTNTEDDAIFAVTEEGTIRTRTGLRGDVRALVPGVGETAWAVGEGGLILRWDGTWWGIQHTPTDRPLEALWDDGLGGAWAVGDRVVLRLRDGQWERADLPRALGDAQWWAVTGAGQRVWLAGSEGVWRLDPPGGLDGLPLDAPWQATPLLGPEAQARRGGGAREESARALWAAGPEDLWVAGKDGLLRRFEGGAGEVVQTGHDRPGATFLALSGTAPDDVWAVGLSGRIAHWDGAVWFDYLPLTRRNLVAVHALDRTHAWAAGDAGELLRWDGLRWTRQEPLPHVDLRGVVDTGDGRVLAGGEHVLVLGPFLHIAKPTNPAPATPWSPWTLRWEVDGVDASLTMVDLMEGSGFPFWTLFSRGGRHALPLPDLRQAWGLDAVWAGPGSLAITRMRIPGASVDQFDYTLLAPDAQRAWSTTQIPVQW